MKALLSVALLSSLLQLCSTAAVLEPLSCSEDNKDMAAHLAMHHINTHQTHGYKFKIGEISGVEVKEVDQGCDIKLQLYLKETECHVIDPRDFEDCPERILGERAVVANCSVMIMVKDNATTVTKYDCVTQQEMTNEEMMRICPDCPKLIALNDPEGLKSINAAVTEFNKNTSNENVFVLQQVGRIRITYISSTGMNYYSEFTLVETVCPRNSRILHKACKPMCPDRAKLAFCRSGYSVMNGLYSVECKFYPAKPLPPHSHGPPPHAHGPPTHAHGPPTHAHGPPTHAHGPPTHAHGPPPPPPHAHGPPPPPPHAHGPHQVSPPPPIPPPFSPHCIPVIAGADPAIYPICPWPQITLLPLLRHECGPIGPKVI